MERLHLFARLRRDVKGGTVMMSALMSLPVLSLAGFALDMERRATADRDLKTAADSAVLAAARFQPMKSTATDEEIKAVAGSFLADNFDFSWLSSMTDPDINVSADGVDISVSGGIGTTMTAMFGLDTLPVSAVAKARFGEIGKVETALVLNNSNSMSGTKLTDLQTAAQGLIDESVDGAANAKVAIIPFNVHVNVGDANRFEPWIDAPPDSSFTKTLTCVDEPASIAARCPKITTTCSSDGVDSSCSAWDCPTGVS